MITWYLLAILCSMLNLRAILERNARLAAHLPALIDGSRRYTYAQHADRVRRLACGLQSRRVRRGDRVSILAMNCAEYFEAYAAAQWTGFILHTINFRLAPPEIEWMLADAEPRILIFEAQYTSLVDQLRSRLRSVERLVCIGDAPSWAESFESVLTDGGVDVGGDVGGDVPACASDDDDCLLAYTSGTTGKPKGVRHTNRSLARVAEVLSSELGLSGDTRLLAIAPVFHAGASTLSWSAQFRGGCVVLHRGFDAQEVVRTIERERITAIHLVPTMVQALLEAPNLEQHDLSSLRMLMYAAAPMPVPLLRRALAKFGPILWNGYGQTEINLMTVLRPHQHVLEGDVAQTRRLASVGQAHWQSAVRIVAEDGAICPAGTIGEVSARSETAMAGYWRNEAATAATIRDGWVLTGDMGYLDDEGYLFLVDRKKDMIISGGENVYSREVEDALMQHAAVLEAAVIGVPDARWGESVKAVVVLAAGAAVSGDGLIAHCRALIAAYKCPKAIEFVAELPRLNTGKINKRALREQFVAQAQPQEHI